MNSYLIILLLILLTPTFCLADNDQEKDQTSITATAVSSTPNEKIRQNPFYPQTPQKIVEVASPQNKVEPIEPQNAFRISTGPSRENAGKTNVLPNLNITGLIWNTDRPQAIVNGQVLDQGDTIENAEIIAIKKDGIDIKYQDNITTVKP